MQQYKTSILTKGGGYLSQGLGFEIAWQRKTCRKNNRRMTNSNTWDRTSHKKITRWRLTLQRRGAARVHQHLHRATRAEGEGRNSELGFDYGPFNHVMHGQGNATLPINIFACGGWIHIVRRMFHLEMIPIILCIELLLALLQSQLIIPTLHVRT